MVRCHAIVVSDHSRLGPTGKDGGRPHGFGGRDSPSGLEAHVSEDLRRDADARRRRGGEEMGRTAAWMLPHGGKQCHAICDFFGYGSVFASASTSSLTCVCFGMYGGRPRMVRAAGVLDSLCSSFLPSFLSRRSSSNGVRHSSAHQIPQMISRGVTHT